MPRGEGFHMEHVIMTEEYSHTRAHRATKKQLLSGNKFYSHALIIH